MFTYSDLSALNDIFIKALPKALEKAARQQTYYTIHFESEETGECFDGYVFASREECIAHEACDSCGYGSVEIKEISRERALEILNEEIRDVIEDEHWDDQYLNLSDPEVYQKFFDSEVDFLIKWKEPGWQLLKEEYRS